MLHNVPIFTFTPVPLDREVSGLLCSLIIAKNAHDNDLEECPVQDSEIADNPAVQILVTRIEAYKLNYIVTDLFAGMSSVAGLLRRPGDVLILLRLMYQASKETGITLFDLDSWCTKLFPDGVPNDVDKKKMWDMQKCKPNRDHFAMAPDNMLDYRENWE